jgi:large subunit ribosomal protein L6
VKVTLGEGNLITVEGPKGRLERKLVPQILLRLRKTRFWFPGPTTKKRAAAARAYPDTGHNMVDGVTKGFEKKLEINGVGYRAAKKEEPGLNLASAIRSSCRRRTIFRSTAQSEPGYYQGIDKQMVGQFAADCS